MVEAVREPATPVETQEAIPAGIDPEVYKRCLDFCQAQGVPLDTLNFLKLGWEKFQILPKKSELRLFKCMDDAFIVPDAEAELAGKSSLELADACVSMSYKVLLFPLWFLFLTS